MVLWFVFILATSLFQLHFYSGEIVEGMVFFFIMGLVVIGISGVVNISLSIDLIADARINEVNFTDQMASYRRKLIRWFGIIFGVLLITAFIGDYFIQKRRQQEFVQVVADIAQVKGEDLFRALGYLQDTANYEDIIELMQMLEISSSRISQVDLLVPNKKNGVERLLTLSPRMDLALMKETMGDNLVTIISGSEKKVVSQLLSGGLTEPQVFENEEGQLLGFAKVKRGGQILVLRVLSKKSFDGGGRRF